MFVRALTTEPVVVPADRLEAAKELISGGATKALLEEAASAEKGVTLLKRSKEAAGCKDLAKTCKALQKVVDIQTNAFGETRLLIVKAGKKQPLDSCSTNANVGIVVAAKDGAKLTVAGVAEPVELKAGEPAVFDFCREASLEAESKTPVLFAQGWHPEFAAVERTSELRARASTFGLSENDLKAVTKAVNDFAKKSWDKSAKQWRSGSDGLERLRSAFKAEVESKRSAEEAAAEAKRAAEEADDEERKRGLEELEKKREEKRRKAAEAEEKRKRRKQQLEEERAKRDPWLLFPEVLAAEKHVEELKEARRDANAKLEFDLSTQLTKDIAAAERALKKAIKQAKKTYKKTGTVPQASAPADAEKGEAAGGEKAENAQEKDLATLKKELEDVKQQKAAASKAENFKEAKRLRELQKELEASISKLEL